MAQYTFDTLKDFELAGISLPSGYQRVEWLQATGTQYINTGLRIGANDVEYNFKWREIIAEARTSLCGNDSPWSGVLYHPSAGVIYAAVGNSDGQGARAIPINSWITAKFAAKNGAWSFRTNGTTLSGSYSGTVISSNYNFSLFCNSGVWQFSKYSQIPFFDLKVGGVLLRSFVACRRTSDSVAGMYDIVNDVFYSNAGTGTFSIGGDVAPITPITGDTATITDLGITLTSDGTDWYVTSDITLATLSQATQLFAFAKGDNGVTATITDLGITLTSNGTDWYVTNNITIPTFSQATQLFSFAKSDNGVTATITDLGITLTSNGTDWYVTNNITIPTFSQATQLFSFAKSDNGVTATITDLGITLTSDGTDWYVTSDITLATFSQATQLFSFAKSDNGVTATITDLGITLTSDGTDWYVTSDITLATLSQATQLFSFAKGNNGVTVTVTSTGGVYKYEGDDWQIWYTIIPPLVFRGITFEQTDYWQIPEMVFRGFSFEGENILRYYGVKIDVNGETERNYIPCIRTSDGIAGMYDTVNGVFYASVGSTNFTT